jgi:GNAT superfamily N-acetyltransferase
MYEIISLVGRRAHCDLTPRWALALILLRCRYADECQSPSREYRPGPCEGDTGLGAVERCRSSRVGWQLAAGCPVHQTVSVLLSSDVAVRVEQVDGDYLHARVTALSQVAGNPYGAAARRVGDGYAFAVRAVPNPPLNHVTGLTSAAADQLGELGRWYAGYGRRLRVEVTPAQASPELFAALARHGLHQSGFYAGLYGQPELNPAAGIGPVQVESADPAEFAECYVRGFEFPVERRAVLAESVQVLAGRADTDFYRARLGASTAGIGMLFRQAGVGYLATAATLPGYRGRGVQTALVRHRIDAAARAGCDLIVGHTAVGGASHRTLERCGLRLAYTKAIWSQPQ